MLGETVLGNGTKGTGTHGAAQVVTSLAVSKWVISLPTSHQNLVKGGENRRRGSQKANLSHTFQAGQRWESNPGERWGRALFEVVADPWY